MNEINSLKEKMARFTKEMLPEFAQYAEFIPGGFFIYQEKEPMEILYVNRRTLDIFGCETLEEFKELTGYTFRGLVHPEDFAVIQSSIDEQIANEENKDLDYVEYRIMRKDGSVRWVDDYGHLVRSEEYGNLYYVFISDITEKKQAMQAVREEEYLNFHEVRALVVDDEPLACEYAKLVLDNVGIVSDICLSGEEALEQMELKAARHEGYDLILLDLRMPKYNGIEVAKQIREKYGDEVTIFILTANSWEEMLEEADEAGIDNFIEKPLFTSTIMEKFGRVLERKKNRNKEHIIDLTGKRILVAEDIAINTEIIIQLLQMEGMEAECAEDGQVTVEMFEKSSLNYYDAILMDVRMPVMNGLDASVRIRNLKRADAKKIPIIAMTANAFDEDVQRSLQAGMNAHLTKPIEIERLYETLGELIR